MRHLDNMVLTAASLQRDPSLVNEKRSVACLETLLVMCQWSMLMYYIEQVRMFTHTLERKWAIRWHCSGHCQS